MKDHPKQHPAYGFVCKYNTAMMRIFWCALLMCTFRLLAQTQETALMPSPIPQKLATPNFDVFAQTFNAVGVTTDRTGNVFIAHDNVTSSVVSKFTSSGNFIGSTQIAGISGINTFGYLAVIPSSGQILDLLPDGRLFTIDPSTGTLTLILDITALNVNAGSIYDIYSRSVDSFGGLLQTRFASFGDLAVFESGNRIDLFVSGLSQAQSFPFLLRLRFQNGVFQEAKVLMSSRAEAGSGAVQSPRLTRGVAVNHQTRTVLTTLPWSNRVSELFDALVVFPVEFEPSDGVDSNERPAISVGFDIYSQGMTTDANGHFFVVTNSVGSVALGAPGEPILAVFSARVDRFLGGFTAGQLATSLRDITISPARAWAYVTMPSMTYRFSLSTIPTAVTESGDEIRIDDFALQQNYPNPFNPSTTITFTLPQRERVRLEIFNLLGERVATLLDEVRAAGVHSVAWQPQSLPSGTYLYRLETKSYSLTRKLVLLR